MDPASPLSRSMHSHKPGFFPPAKYSIIRDSHLALQRVAKKVDLAFAKIAERLSFSSVGTAHPIIPKTVKHHAAENNDFFEPGLQLHVFKIVKQDAETLSLVYHGKGPDLTSEKGCKKLLGHCKSKESKYAYTKIPTKEEPKPQFMVFHQEHAEQFAGMKLVIKADSASPEIKKLASDLNGKPIAFVYMSSEGLLDFQAKLTLMMVPFQAGSEEPHAKTSSEDIRKLHQDSPHAKDAVKTKDPFAFAKEVLMRIFLSSYQEKIAIEQERTRKAREQEKENKRDLERKDRIHDIEKKEQQTAADNLELSAKNRNRHRLRQKESLEIDSKLRS